MVAASCSGGGGDRTADGARSGRPAAEVTRPPAPEVAFVPGSQEADVALDAPVHVSVTFGRLLSVVATGGPGAQPITGQIDPTQTRWVASGRLTPSTTYQLAAKVAGKDGSTTEARSSFTTAAPKNKLTARVAPLNGSTVGVGHPVAVYLSKPIADHAAVERLLTVTTTPAVAGAWRWFSDSELHWRPEQYWQPGTKVNLVAALAGVDFGGGIWGTESRDISFTIGDAHISVVDDATHQMTVTTNGKVERVIPVSLGREKYPTKSGVHVVMGKERTTVMDSASFGVPAGSSESYRTTVHWAVRISNSGEFVHAAPWSVADQGRRNVSHGCVNVSVAHATWFFKYSLLGDVVEVKGTPVQIAPTNGFGDWNIPWPEWSPAAAPVPA